MFHYWRVKISLPTNSIEGLWIGADSVLHHQILMIHHRCMRVMIEPFLDILFIAFFWVACVKTPDQNSKIARKTGFDPSQRIPMGIWGPRRQSGCGHVVSALPQNEPTHPIFLSQKGEEKKHGHLNHESIIYDLSWTSQFCGLPKLTV